MNKLLLSAALALALTPSLAGDAVAAKSFQFMFINHTNLQLHFSVDEAYACTANAGMVCYSRIAVGPHTFRAAMGEPDRPKTSGTLYENAQSPAWTVCNGDDGTCPVAAAGASPRAQVGPKLRADQCIPARTARVGRYFLSENRKGKYNTLAPFRSPRHARRRQPPIRNPAASRERTRHIFARLMQGQSTAAIAAAEGVSLRRVQQIVHAELARREANPAEDYAIMQIARLERALDLLGGQIEAGRASAAPAFVRTIEILSKLAARPLRLDSPVFREIGAVAAMTERLARLDAAREIVAERALAADTKQNDGQAIEKTEFGETADCAEASQS